MSDITGLSQVVITSEGRQMHERLRFPPPYNRVAATLYEGNKSVDEAAMSTGMNRGKLISALQVMEKHGYVRVHRTSDTKEAQGAVL